MTATPPKSGTQANGSRGRWLLIGSAVLAGLLLVVYLWQPDPLAGLILVPAWSWLLPGLLLTVRGGWRQRFRVWGPVAGLWLLFTLGCLEEPDSLIRGLAWQSGWRRSVPADDRIRVVSLNCNISASAADVLPLRPDIVLLQESPQRQVLESLARQLYGERGSVLWTPDCSILADGPILPRHADPASHFVHGTVLRPDGRRIEVICLRLSAPVPRIDLWTLDWWRAQFEKRREHQQQLQDVARVIAAAPQDVPLVMGGDFNLPARDAALRELPRAVRDSFRLAGHGWGQTALNDTPLWRVDQLWVNRLAQPIRVRAQRTSKSDHRLVIADVRLGKP